MKKQLYRAAAATVLGLSLTTGIVAADTGNIDTTGPNSSNEISSEVHNRTHVRNTNHVSLSNTNDQSGYSGDARVTYNTTGGDATSGDVQNENSTTAEVRISNSMNQGKGAAPSSSSNNSASIENTGPGSDNQVESTVSNHVDVSNNNQVTIDNTSTQTGTTGDATVSNNTTGGNATSGSVYNSNSSSFTLSISN